MIHSTNKSVNEKNIATAVNKHEYRPEIDGLRAIAIVPVVLFHTGLAGFSASEWNTIMKAPPLPHSHYPTDWAFQKNSHPMYQYFRRMATGRKQL